MLALLVTFAIEDAVRLGGFSMKQCAVFKPQSSNACDVPVTRRVTYRQSRILPPVAPDALVKRYKADGIAHNVPDTQTIL